MTKQQTIKVMEQEKRVAEPEYWTIEYYDSHGIAQCVSVATVKGREVKAADFKAYVDVKKLGTFSDAWLQEDVIVIEEKPKPKWEEPVCSPSGWPGSDQ